MRHNRSSTMNWASSYLIFPENPHLYSLFTSSLPVGLELGLPIYGKMIVLWYRMQAPPDIGTQLHATLDDLEARSALHINGEINTDEFYHYIEKRAVTLLETYQAFIGEKYVREALLEISKQYAYLQEYAGRILKTEQEIAGGRISLSTSNLAALMHDGTTRTIKGLRLWLKQFKLQEKLSEIREQRDSTWGKAK